MQHEFQNLQIITTKETDSVDSNAASKSRSGGCWPWAQNRPGTCELKKSSRALLWFLSLLCKKLGTGMPCVEEKNTHLSPLSSFCSKICSDPIIRQFMGVEIGCLKPSPILQGGAPLRITYTSMTLSIHFRYVFRLFMNIWWFNGPMDSMACFKRNGRCWNHGQILQPWGTLTSQLPARDLPPQLKRTWAWDRLAWRGSLVLCLTNTYIMGT